MPPCGRAVPSIWSSRFDWTRCRLRWRTLEQRRRVRSDGGAKGQLVTLDGRQGRNRGHVACHPPGLQPGAATPEEVRDGRPASRAWATCRCTSACRRHRYSFYELVHNTDRLDRDLLEGFLLRHDSGLEVLDSPESIDAFPHTSPEAIEHTLAFLADSYDFVIDRLSAGLERRHLCRNPAIGPVGHRHHAGAAGHPQCRSLH